MAVGFAAGGAGEDQRQYGGRVTAFAALSCITAAMGGAIFGYDIGISGQIHPQLTMILRGVRVSFLIAC